MKTFSIKEMFKEGWLITKTHFGFFIILLLIVFIGMSIPLSISDYLFDRHSLWGALFYLIYLIISLTFSMGMIQVALHLVDHKETHLTKLFTCFPYIGRYFFGQLLYMLILLAGLILLVFPMFIWGVKYSYFAFFIVDKHLRPIAALKESGKLTYGHKWKLFWFSILATLLNAAGALCFGIGLFVTVPITLVAQAAIFRFLQTPPAVQIEP